MSLTADELRALGLTAELVNLVCQKVIGHGESRVGDVNEFCHHIHNIQHMIMAQSAARQHPDQFRLLGEVIEVH